MRTSEATAAVDFEAVWLVQHRAVIPRTFIPAVFLTRRMARDALLDRRPDPLATLDRLATRGLPPVRVVPIAAREL